MNKPNPYAVATAYERADNDREQAWVEYIRLMNKLTGNVGCTAEEFYKVLNQLLEMAK